MRAERRPKEPKIKREPEREQEFARLWNLGLSVDALRRRLKYGSNSAVTGYAARLRRLGYRLAVRHGRAGKRAQSRKSRDFSETVLVRVAVPPAVVTDASGKLVGYMDPVTRKTRRPKP